MKVYIKRVLIMKQDRQCTYNVTLKHPHVANDAVEKH